MSHSSARDTHGGLRRPRSPQHPGQRSIPPAAAQVADLAELRDQVETIAHRQMQVLQTAIGQRAQETAALRQDLTAALDLIDRKFAEDRRILAEVQFQVDRAESDRGNDSATLRN